MKKDKNVIELPSIITNVALLNLTREVAELKEQYRATCEMAVKSILVALDCKDHYTYGHSTRVAYFALVLGRELKLSADELYDLEITALFHDIGKIGVPDSVLLKPGKLTPEEFELMKQHPVYSAKILEGFEPFNKVAEFAKFHHERYDGKGYPSGLKGEDIPFFSRILLIADTFDAMTSSRPYRKGLSYDVAFDELKRFSGTQFDPMLVLHFLRAMKKEMSKNEDTFHLSIIKGDFSKQAA